MDLEIVGLLDEARRAEAVDARGRQRWLRDQARESATFASALIDLAEARRTVVVETTAGRQHVGRVRAVGLDYCLVETTTCRLAAVVLDAVASVRTPGPDWPAPTTDRRLQRHSSFHALLAELVADQQRASVGLGAQAATVTGRLWSLGADVLTVRVDGRESGLSACQLRVVTEIVTDVSGPAVTR